MEFAIIETGGKQYIVSKGDSITIEKVAGEYKVGDKLTFDKVLLVDNGTDTSIGEPYIPKAHVDAEIKEIGLGDKVMVVKYKQKSRYHKKRGHRQPYFTVAITAIK